MSFGTVLTIWEISVRGPWTRPSSMSRRYGVCPGQSEIRGELGRRGT